MMRIDAGSTPSASGLTGADGSVGRPVTVRNTSGGSVVTARTRRSTTVVGSAKFAQAGAATASASPRASFRVFAVVRLRLRAFKIAPGGRRWERWAARGWGPTAENDSRT